LKEKKELKKKTAEEKRTLLKRSGVTRNFHWGSRPGR